MGETPDLSMLFEMLSKFNGPDQNNIEMPDMETILRLSKIMKSMNSSENNASANLLNSLKPFLRKTKQEKIDQYVKIMKISSVISEINKDDDK